MSQNIPPVPADLKCGFCQKPVQGEYYRTLNRFACTACAGQVQGVIDRNILPPPSFVRAATAGLLVSLTCAAAWAVIGHATHHEIGYVAWLSSIAVAKAVSAAAGKRRGTALQWLAAGLSVVGIIGGKIALAVWFTLDHYGKAVTLANAAAILQHAPIKDLMTLFGGYDLLWLGIAVYAAFRICKAPPITLAGPYPLVPQDAGLQFETIEPVTPAAPEQS